jgi:hypothetical protein
MSPNDARFWFSRRLVALIMSGIAFDSQNLR